MNCAVNVCVDGPCSAVDCKKESTAHDCSSHENLHILLIFNSLHSKFSHSSASFFDVPIRWVKSRFFQIEHKNMISIWKTWYSWALRGHNSLFWRKIITIQINIGLRVKSQRVTVKGMTVVRVLCTNNSDDCSLQGIVKKSKFNKLGEFHKEWMVSVDQEPPHTDGLPERGYWNANKNPCLNRRSIWHELRKARSVSVAQRSKVFSSGESKISILWENQGPTVLRKNREKRCLNSSVKFLPKCQDYY